MDHDVVATAQFNILGQVAILHQVSNINLESLIFAVNIAQDQYGGLLSKFTESTTLQYGIEDLQLLAVDQGLRVVDCADNVDLVFFIRRR